MKRIFKWSLLALALMSVGCTQKWEEYRWEDWGCSVLLPQPSTVYLPVLGKGTTGYLDAGEFTLNTPKGQVVIGKCGYISNMRNTWRCIVGSGELITSEGKTVSAEEIMDYFYKFATDLTESIGGKGVEVVYKKNISVESMEGIEYQLKHTGTYVKRNGREKKYKYTETARVLVSDSRFYQLEISSDGRIPPRNKIDKFFNSFHLIPCTGEPGSQKTHPPDRYEDVVAEPDSSDVPIVDYYKIEKKPQVVNQHTPVYPAKAQNEGHEGTVFVNALVGPYGHVIDVEILQSSGWEELDNAALEAARHWTFTPGEQRGKPVKVWVRIPFHFKL
ncbi:energy transducer TonB [candidate division WOR-3 bacterium]|nr:energy transducer TonB [candidate division WOR-3 bacterium]